MVGLILAGGAWLWPGGEDPDGPQMVQIDTGEEEAALPPPTRASLVGLRGDPLILRLEEGDAQSGPRVLPTSPPLATRAATGVSVIATPLLTRAARLATALPSSREDFALFQAQRAEGLSSLLNDDPTEEEAAPGRVVSGEEAEAAAGSWGEVIDTGQAVEEVSFVETAIENTTSIVSILPEARRSELFADTVVVVRVEQSLETLLSLNGLSEDAAAQVVAGIGRITGLTDGAAVQLPLEALPVGSVVGLRMQSGQLLQMSLYGPEGYAFSVAQVGAGRFAAAADPWIEADLMDRSRDLRQDAVATRDVRLLDAIWSAALQGGLEGSVTGELLVMMSKRFDLDRNAAPGDRLILLHGTGAGAESVLYAGVEGPSGPMACFVVKDAAGGFGCHDPDATVSGGGMSGALVTPVAGTRTSGFGPRMHPILKQLRNHNGVDWAAPTGTPVMAAAAGKIAVRGAGGGYGNVVYIDHPGGLQTRYAHLDRFEPGQEVGSQVAAGDRIGYVGTTGRSTGPHLHFELHVAGRPVDPLTFASAPTGGDSGGASAAVDALVNRIIEVESAGNAAAKNPLSTATGLGQFIESTWLRMMRTYRPDLVAKMDRQALLALRTDPYLSREMVRNLARESESYLRARGHQITAGRLYLAHFLGAEGADRSLRNDPNLSVLQVMGAGVVGANPFLRNMSNLDMQNWAERKMSGRGASAPVIASAPVAAPVSEETKAYLGAVEELLEQL
ncbi:peptidoglycan DD-metalloendopeptidase family protein [Jannaschia pohangensis]|uniref:Murein DD-endopeptidase MepM and murein hydrolase activator NlpD, contain LysM domain n=1 Tax=Jannaschia pohangensis TaxID=390807 RepID=A0A1I3UK57_9RHOB|nr:peptidoglycan DD-metalloendopeptidase family protein [Jannaschia pohangensis]SFJ83275.1 Murein DD-endopeptidase MepM and murein hydrolase activator NlpD, contain LysM domain [Jannaschia pohangensis]